MNAIAYKPAWCSAIVVLAVCNPGWAQKSETITKLLEDYRVEKNIPGLRAAIRTRDGRIISASVGFADKEAGTLLDDEIGMPGGSTGKTFVATVAMLLVEDGTLSLDDPISKWVGKADWYPQLPNAEDIQVRHLLSHSSGIPDYPYTGSFRRAMIWRVIRNGSAKFQPEELIRYSLHGKKPPFAVGEGFRYSDTGYLVLGRVIESASKRTYYELLQERVLDPQALDGIRPQNVSVLTDIATGYMAGARCRKKDGRMKLDPSSEWTGGGLVMTPTMLARFYSALAEGRIVKPDSLALMLKGEWQNPDEPNWRYGYGLFVYDEGKSFGHAGLWSGYRTDVRHFLSSGLTVAVQANRDGRIELEKLIARLEAASRVPRNN